MKILNQAQYMLYMVIFPVIKCLRILPRAFGRSICDRVVEDFYAHNGKGVINHLQGEKQAPL